MTAGPTAMSATATTAPGNEAVIGNPRAASYGAAAVAMTAGAATAEVANEAEAAKEADAVAIEAEAANDIFLRLNLKFLK